MTLLMTKYFSSKYDAKQTNRHLNNSNCTIDSVVPINNNIPLRVLIRQMLDEAFGESNRTINAIEDQCNVENKNCEIHSSLISLKDENINSHNKTNCSLYESISDGTKCKSKLVTIEEESTNSLQSSDSIEYTGIYLSGLLESNDKPVNRIKNDNPLPSRSDTEIFTSQADTDISINDSCCRTNIVNDELSICQQNDDDRDESVMIINKTHSFNDADVSSSNENTAEFLNILKKKNSPETKQMSYESLNSLTEDRTESSIDTSLINVVYAAQGTPKFISTLTLKSRTPTSSNKNNKPYKTPCCNTTLAKKQVQYRSSFYVKVRKTAKTTKTSKVYPNRAKSFKSREIPKQRQMIGPEIIFTPATPK